MTSLIDSCLTHPGTGALGNALTLARSCATITTGVTPDSSLQEEPSQGGVKAADGAYPLSSARTLHGKGPGWNVMIVRIFILLLCLIVLAVPARCPAEVSETAKSCWLSGLVHEENSVVASALYLPYVILLGPVAIAEAIFYPKPATQGTIPPPAHRVSH